MHRTPRAGRTRRLGWALVIASPLAGLVSVNASAAPVPVVEQALDQCRGNNQIQIAPYSCERTRDIDGTTFTARIVVTAGGALTVTITMAEPRETDTPIRFRSHRGVSSGPTTVESSGVIPAGQTSGVLSTGQIGCGQIDVKAVFTGNGDATGRITAPYVTTEDDCQEQVTTTTGATTTTTAATTTTEQTQTSAGATTTPTTTATSTPPTSALLQVTPAPPTSTSITRLPTTGSPSTWPAAIAGGLLAMGILMLGIGRRTTTP